MRLSTFLAATTLLASALLAAPATVAAAGAVKVATFNVGWLWTPAVHARWKAACERIGWDPDRARGARAEALQGLPYCNVHNGLKWPPHLRCRRVSKEEVLQRPLVDDKGCRESKDLVDWRDYEDKLASLRANVAALDAEGVTLIAFQEVFDTASLRQILPRGWQAATSADDAAAPAIPQHVGVAWKASATSAVTVGPLLTGLSAAASRPLRPGFTFTTRIGGRPTEFLVVHLKASCASQRTDIHSPVTANEQDACPALERQVLALEAWVDDRVGQDFVILGDFNRRLTFEPKTAPDTGARPDPRVAQMFSELNDDDPPGSTLWIATPRRVPSANGRQRTENCPNGHTAIDHVIVSASLKARMDVGPLEVLPITVDGTVPYKAGMEPFVAAPTDHCAHWVQLTPR